jgi:hypothetical protein
LINKELQTIVARENEAEFGNERKFNHSLHPFQTIIEMSYSDFKTLDDVKSQFNITVSSSGSLFSTINEITPTPQLIETLKEHVELALNINTEKARSELIIAPLVVEVRKLLNREISLFSGLEFNVDETLGLNGYCDFILSKSPNQIVIETPVICIVEAKNENIKSGYAQCIAEMIAAERFNNCHSHPVNFILGVVTTGSNWKFLKLENQVVVIDFNEYLISQVGKILGIFIEAIQGNSSRNS